MDYLEFEYFDRRLGETAALLGRILARLDLLSQEGEIMSAELDALSVQVRANTDAEQSAVMLLGRLSDLIRAAGTDPAKLSALTHDLDASRQTLAQAVVANTPAAPPPTPTPAPTPTPGPTVSGPGQAPAGPTSTPGAQTPGQSKP